MGLFERDVEEVAKAVRSWKPGRYATEGEYEEDLYHYLHSVFPTDQVERQHIRGKSKADIFVKFIFRVAKTPAGCGVVVELKRDLKDRGNWKHLIGQLYEYTHSWKVEVLIVLCGNADPELRRLAQDATEDFGRWTMKKVRLAVIPS